MKVFLGLIAACIFNISWGQVKTTLITYKSAINLAKQNSNIEYPKDEQLSFEVDLYCYEGNVRTKKRLTKSNENNPMLKAIKEFIYTQDKRAMFSLDDTRQMAFETNIPTPQLAKSGRQKEILGYKCYEWVQETYKVKYWITDEIGVNVSPTGNLGILGTVLEYESPYGSRTVAVKIKQAEIDKSDFDIPTGYQVVNMEKSFSQIEMERVKWKDKQLPLQDFIDITGKKHTKDSLNEKIVVINFWFTTCKPCIEEMPVLNEIKMLYATKYDVVFVAISPDKKEKIEEFLKKRDFNYSIISSASDFIQTIGVNSFPTNMILDKNGKVIYESTGFHGNATDMKKRIVEIIEDLLR